MLALKIAREFGMKMKIGLMRKQFQYGGGTDDC